MTVGGDGALRRAADPEGGSAPAPPGAAATPRTARATAATLPPFDRVVDEHGPAVLRFCVSRAGASGEDVFQETMISALRAYPELRDPAAVRGWLFSIAHRKTIDAARVAARTPRPGGTPEELELAAGRGAGAGGGAAGGAAIDRAHGGPWDRVRELPPKQREAVTLRYLGDLTNAEVASIMDTSEEASRRNVFEGLKRLRRLVERD